MNDCNCELSTFVNELYDIAKKNKQPDDDTPNHVIREYAQLYWEKGLCYCKIMEIIREKYKPT